MTIHSWTWGGGSHFEMLQRHRNVWRPLPCLCPFSVDIRSHKHLYCIFDVSGSGGVSCSSRSRTGSVRIGFLWTECTALKYTTYIAASAQPNLIVVIHSLVWQKETTVKLLHYCLLPHLWIIHLILMITILTNLFDPQNIRCCIVLFYHNPHDSGYIDIRKRGKFATTF